MGYRGKVEQREQARILRGQAMTLADIAAELGVAKSTVSLWVRDVPFTASKRRYGPRIRPNVLMQRKQDEIEWANAEGAQRVGCLSEREFLMAGVALYAGEGSKTDGAVMFPNSDPAMVAFFLAWLRHFFDVDESRLRLRLYLHEGLDLDAATAFWEEVTAIPRSQHTSPYRASDDDTRRHNKHIYGCPRIAYSCSKTHREVMGLVRALLSCDRLPG